MKGMRAFSRWFGHGGYYSEKSKERSCDFCYGGECLDREARSGVRKFGSWNESTNTNTNKDKSKLLSRKDKKWNVSWVLHLHVWFGMRKQNY